MHSSKDHLYEFLEMKTDRYNRAEFIDSDPISIPHRFSDGLDIEIAGFLTATISWGQRPVIIKNAGDILSLMGPSPYDFLMEATDDNLQTFGNAGHRTFKGEDCIYFMKSLRHIYRKYGGLGAVFQEEYVRCGGIKQTMENFRKIFFELKPPSRTEKHVPDVSSGASAKRLNMLLRWMVRSDERGVDFGIWDQIPMSALYIPLDVHSGSVARKLGLLKRKQDDWKAVEELTSNLRKLNPEDPVKYDYALFGLGVFENF